MTTEAAAPKPPEKSVEKSSAWLPEEKQSFINSNIFIFALSKV